VHDPLLVQDGLERQDRDFAQQREDVLISKRGTRGLIGYSQIRVARIKRYAVLQQPKRRGQVSLSHKVHMGIGCEVTTILDVAGT
jgi:hypothetical protein